MTGTFGGALEARNIPADEDHLWSSAIGEIEKVDGILVIKRIHIVYHLKIAEADWKKAERAYAHHAENCPSYRSIGNCVHISTSIQFEEPPS
jgi:uncharacterized OsmC-like protein